MKWISGREAIRRAAEEGALLYVWNVQRGWVRTDADGIRRALALDSAMWGDYAVEGGS